MLQQGARSTVTRDLYHDIDCIHKVYNDQKADKRTKLKNELLFYQRYSELDIIPKFIATDEESIWVEYRDGERHIDLVRAGIDLERNHQLSLDYGKKAAAFLTFDRQNPLQDPFDLPSYMTSIIDRFHEVKTHNARHFRVYKDHLEAYLTRLFLFNDPYWLAPMISKSDFSSSNLFISGNEVTCIYDFDTAYLVNRIIFMGDMLNSCLHLDWPLVKQGLIETSGPLPPPSRPATLSISSMKMMPPCSTLRIASRVIRS